VTGGAGFIGSHLVDALVARGDSVVILDDLSTGRLENVERALDSGVVEFVEGSVIDEDLVGRCLARVDRCFHLASAVGVKLIVENSLESMLRNVRGLDVVIGAAARCETRLLFTSTSEIYGKGSEEALEENADRLLGSPWTPRWSYATAKTFGETIACGYNRERGAEMIVTRLFNTVGPRQTGTYGMVLPRFVRQAVAGEDVTVYGDGAQSRCFAHVFDSVRALLLLMDTDLAVGNVYNVGSSTEIPIVELARRVIERSRSGSEIRFVPYEDAYGDGFEELGRRKPDTTAVRRLSGWVPELTVEDAIEDVIAHERARVAASRRGRDGVPQTEATEGASVG